MTKPRADVADNIAPATSEDIRGILGNIDGAKLLAILELRPTVANVEEASLWMAGDNDIFGAGKPVKGVASRIITILTEDEEEERGRTG
jgi:hypothetical protein